MRFWRFLFTKVNKTIIKVNFVVIIYLLYIYIIYNNAKVEIHVSNEDRKKI